MRMLRTCFSTVASVTQSSREIPLLERPSAMSAITSRSRGVSTSSGSSDAAGRDELGDENRIHDRAAPHDPLQRLDEVIDVGDPALQQVAATFTAGEQVHRVLDLDVRGQDQDGDVRELGADHAGRVETLGGMVRRHPDVHDGQFRFMLPDQRDELRPVTGLADHDKSGPLEQAGQALPEEDVVVGQRDPDAGFGHPY